MNTSLKICGFLSILLGLIVIIGWHTETVSLIQILPTFVPMQYNTALGFLLGGSAFVALNAGKSQGSLILGFIVALIGALTLVEYIFNINFGIDQLFMEHYVTVKTSHPGRMAPNTALSFFVTGLYFIITFFAQDKKYKQVVLTFLGSIVFATALVALMGYILSIESAYGWQKLTRMAVHTSIGFIILSLGILGKQFFSSNKDDVEILYPISIGFMSLLIFILFAQALNQADYHKNLPELFLLFGIVLSLLLGIVFYLFQKTKSAEKKLKKHEKKLEDRVKKEVRKSRKKDQIIIQKSRLIAMGEMISMIAHQWRQPLSAITAITGSVRFKNALAEDSNEVLDEKMIRIETLAQELSTIIDDFRYLYKSSDTYKPTNINTTVGKSIDLVKDLFKADQIQIIKNFEDDGIQAIISERGFIQVILNLLSNSRDAIIERGVTNPKIIIDIIKDAHNIYITVEDNAGGIPKDIIDQVFDPYFSTKGENGTGIGLHLAYTVITENFNGMLSVENTELGAKFIIRLPLENNLS